MSFVSFLFAVRYNLLSCGEKTILTGPSEKTIKTKLFQCVIDSHHPLFCLLATCALFLLLGKNIRFKSVYNHTLHV